MQVKRKLQILARQDNLRTAAKELRAGLIRLFPAWDVIVDVDIKKLTFPAIHLTTETLSGVSAGTRKAIKQVLAGDNDAFCIHTIVHRKHLVIAGNSKRAIFFGVYHYLRRAFGLFYDFHKDIYPRKRYQHPIAGNMNIVEISTNSIRSYKPQILGNYSDLHSAWSWDFKRWRRLVEWCVRQRYNVLHLMFFAQGNWIRFDCAPEARGVPDPYMNTEERIEMVQRIISLCHDYGLKFWAGYCTNATQSASRKSSSCSPVPGRHRFMFMPGYPSMTRLMRPFYSPTK